jgi:Icc-related predicted phosphoesterase
MKILLTADLHSNRAWYEWLTGEASHYDLVAIAGDLIDAFGIDEQGQVDWLRGTWLPKFRQQGVPLAVCSGNHDLAAKAWLIDLNTLQDMVGDGVTRLLTLRSGTKLVITTCPSNQWGDPPPLIAPWEEGTRLRDQEQCPWLVLHHEPPRELAPRKFDSSLWLKWQLGRFHPDFVACGHFHITGNLPFAAKVGTTSCFQAGQHPKAPRPYHIILDLSARTATRVRMVSLRGTLSWVEQTHTVSLK